MNAAAACAMLGRCAYYRGTMSTSLPTLQRCQWRTGPTSTFNRATWRQRLTRITEDLQFFSDSDKDWILGRSIVARLSSPPAGYLVPDRKPLF